VQPDNKTSTECKRPNLWTLSRDRCAAPALPSLLVRHIFWRPAWLTRPLRLRCIIRPRRRCGTAGHHRAGRSVWCLHPKAFH
jgi:hypothetical protein